jgi:hypothetical protein
VTKKPVRKGDRILPAHNNGQWTTALTDPDPVTGDVEWTDHEGVTVVGSVDMIEAVDDDADCICADLEGPQMHMCAPKFGEAL